jgi:membrane-associated phospholipid phosphatase
LSGVIVATGVGSVYASGVARVNVRFKFSAFCSARLMDVDSPVSKVSAALKIRSVALSLAVCVAPLCEIRSQTQISGDSIHAAKTLFTWRDGVLAGGFTGLTVAMFPVDRSLARRLQDSSAQANRFFKNASKNIQYFADPGSIVIGVSMYAVGRVAQWRTVEDLGLHGTEAVAVSGVVTAVLKGVVGRARPYVSADTSPHDFGFWRGFGHGGGYQSFPSGHSTAAFAAAAVVTSESQRWWPHGAWLVAPVMYGGATLVGLSRMYNNAHWASDVALGAAIGTFSGIKVVRYSHGHSDNPIDRWLLGIEVIPLRDGAGIGWSVAP